MIAISSSLPFINDSIIRACSSIGSGGASKWILVSVLEAGYGGRVVVSEYATSANTCTVTFYPEPCGTFSDFQISVGSCNSVYSGAQSYIYSDCEWTRGGGDGLSMVVFANQYRGSNFMKIVADDRKINSQFEIAVSKAADFILNRIPVGPLVIMSLSISPSSTFTIPQDLIDALRTLGSNLCSKINNQSLYALIGSPPGSVPEQISQTGPVSLSGCFHLFKNHLKSKQLEKVDNVKVGTIFKSIKVKETVFEFIKSLPKGTKVICQTTSNNISSNKQRLAFQMIGGCKYDMKQPYDALYTIIGIKGSSPGSAMEMHSEIKSKIGMGSFERRDMITDLSFSSFNYHLYKEIIIQKETMTIKNQCIIIWVEGCLSDSFQSITENKKLNHLNKVVQEGCVGQLLVLNNDTNSSTSISEFNQVLGFNIDQDITFNHFTKSYKYIQMIKRLMITIASTSLESVDQIIQSIQNADKNKDEQYYYINILANYSNQSSVVVPSVNDNTIPEWFVPPVQSYQKYDGKMTFITMVWYLLSSNMDKKRFMSLFLRF
ncbi:hypothetical protein DFA_08190 [Cavenderia fasciculata]|uniref:ILEI/PANDER domain-containing protein n=1 Tax=Cavenderia fasciculata TaxID=261658 RepID=F4Q5E4_CACFS|nr:uncharacterized protein DFA_08190 [Cavenderia fasciculata]EGG17203.1 hypothetical protein DFA_08190 [Cavenderia fasciculata]|eukprot:XP_004355687.1 hypothetical protein DFA_08190 [Cavenderia fasciculata]